MKYSRLLSFVLSVIVFGSKAVAAESSFSYFSNPDLNFWGQSRTQPANAPVRSARSAAPTKIPSQAGTSTFPWQKYLDPKNDDFFREGDYSPPAPFMEIARNPSDSNFLR